MSINPTVTEAANFAKHKMYDTPNTFGHIQKYVCIKRELKCQSQFTNIDYNMQKNPCNIHEVSGRN